MNTAKPSFNTEDTDVLAFMLKEKGANYSVHLFIVQLCDLLQVFFQCVEEAMCEGDVFSFFIIPRVVQTVNTGGQ